MLLNELNDIAVFSARPASVALSARIDVEGGTVVVMEGTTPFERLSRGAQVHITTDDIDNVIGFFDLLDQGYPIVGQGGTHSLE